MSRLKLMEFQVVDSSNLFDQRVLTLPQVIGRLWQEDPRTHDLRWCGPKNKDGYGVIRSKAVLDWLKERELIRLGAHSILAHVCNYVCYHRRPLRDGWTVDHREGICPLRHTLCGHPLHLEAVPNGINAKRGNEANYRPIQHVPRLFDAQWYDTHIPAGSQQTQCFLPSEANPMYRASRWDKQHGLDHTAIQAAFAL